jgi:hypothetical protein
MVETVTVQEMWVLPGVLVAVHITQVLVALQRLVREMPEVLVLQVAHTAVAVVGVQVPQVLMVRLMRLEMVVLVTTHLPLG